VPGGSGGVSVLPSRAIVSAFLPIEIGAHPSRVSVAALALELRAARGGQPATARQA
jgi:hypothetical protein